MRSHEFYRLYANTPLDQRFVALNFRKTGLTTLSDIYKRVKEIEDKIRPDVIELERLFDFIKEIEK